MEIEVKTTLTVQKVSGADIARYNKDVSVDWYEIIDSDGDRVDFISDASYAPSLIKAFLKEAPFTFTVTAVPSRIEVELNRNKGMEKL